MTAKWKRPILTLMLPTLHRIHKNDQEIRGRNSNSNLLGPSVRHYPEQDSRSKNVNRRWWPSRHFSKRCMCKMLLLLNLASIIGWSVYTRFATANYFRILNQDVHHLAKHFKLRKCNFPKLNPFADEILPYLSKPSSVNCAHSGNPIGEVIFVQERGTRVLRKVGNIDGNCCYRPFHREGDDELQSEDECTKITSKRTVIPEEHEFIEVICVGGRDDYRDGFAFVNKKPEFGDWLHEDEAMDQNEQDETISYFPSSSRNKDGNKISVMLLGLDATSHMNFLRMMPKSNSYLLNNLSAIVMQGYTKVAENTLPNIVPLLTGQTFEDFKKSCVDSTAASQDVHLDHCPFIWKKFAAHGFATGFAEDDISIGIFNMNWRNAFETQPTDYYLRPFSTLMQRHQESSDGQCYGTRLSFKVLLDNLENLAVSLKDRPYFHLTWATKISHNNFNKLSVGDLPLLRFLKFMHKSNHLNNTVLFVMSDHGSRLDGIRKTSQGKLEDRMPLLYVVLPPWFSTKYPEAVANLKGNSERLTSVFDLHETLHDFMDLTRLENVTMDEEMVDIRQFDISTKIRRSRSLFKKILDNRTCFDAGIPLHWCVCRGGGDDKENDHHHPIITLDLENAEVVGAVQYALDSMNYHLRGQRSCSALTLHRTTDAFYINFDDAVDEELKELKKKSGDDEIEKLAILRISFVAVPGKGAFEATLLRRGVDRPWMLTEQVVRTNEYGSQANCVEQEFKEFCYCIS